MAKVVVRVYAELNAFLPPDRRQRDLEVALPPGATVKAVVEDLGVPHPEIDLLLLNGTPVGFDHRPTDGDRIAAYPAFESWDIAGVTRVHPRPLRDVRFLLDVHLGRLARLLRMLGFDSSWNRLEDDGTLAQRAAAERRVLLTRDRGLLKRREVTHGLYLRSTLPRDQLHEIVRRLDLSRSARPFSRCLACNALLAPPHSIAAAAGVPPWLAASGHMVSRCPGCGRRYWRGTHWQRMRAVVEEVLGEGGKQQRCG